MDISLTGQGFTFVVTLLVAITSTIVVAKMSRRWKRSVLPLIVACALALAVLLPLPLAHFARAPGELPVGLWLMLMPATLGFGLLVALIVQHVYHRRKRLSMPFYRNHGWKIYGLAVVAAIGGLLLSAVFVDGYYRLYPTFGSLMGHESAGTDYARSDFRSSAGGHVRIDTTEAALYPDQRRITAGTITPLKIPGTVSRFNSQPGYVYSPPVAANNSVQLPAIVLMPGTPGLPHDWLNGGQLKQTTDAFAAAHNGISPYVFIIDANGSATGDTECVDSSRGNVETFLTQDVPSYIKAHYNVSPLPTSWAIGGLSLGGTCGIMTALRHPDVYRYFLDFAGDSGPSLGSQQQTIITLFGGSRTAFESHLPANLMQQGVKAGVGGYFTNATRDDPGALIATRSLSNSAHKAGMDMVYQVVPGRHSYDAWSQNYRDALPWISNRLGATDCASTCVQ